MIEGHSTNPHKKKTINVYERAASICFLPKRTKQTDRALRPFHHLAHITLLFYHRSGATPVDLYNYKHFSLYTCALSYGAFELYHNVGLILDEPFFIGINIMPTHSA